MDRLLQPAHDRQARKLNVTLRLSQRTWVAALAFNIPFVPHVTGCHEVYLYVLVQTEMCRYVSRLAMLRWVLEL